MADSISSIGADKGFNPGAFYSALETTVSTKGVTWRQVSQETGVSTTTLTRMAQGRKPDAASLAALSAWAGLNPADYVEQPNKPDRPEVLAMIATLLQSDPNLNPDAARTLNSVIQTAYKGLRKKDKSTSQPDESAQSL